MPIPYKLGKRPAVYDPRIPRMSSVTRGQLPLPPPAAHWGQNVGEWPMLANNVYGDCVEAAILHALQQFSLYSGNMLLPTDDDAIKFYEATGFTPDDPASDQGSLVLGPTGMVPYWHSIGITSGGTLNKCAGSMRIAQANPTEMQQAIFFFGGILLGFQVPASLMAADMVPAIWQEFAGPYVGGHEVWVNGYDAATDLYDLVSWGATYRCTQAFIRHLQDEIVVVVDPVECNARGVNWAGLDLTQLANDLRFA